MRVLKFGVDVYKFLIVMMKVRKKYFDRQRSLLIYVSVAVVAVKNFYNYMLVKKKGRAHPS